MNILVTSGGTIIKIDDVRHIGNFSSGEFLSSIAEEAIAQKHKVIYIFAKGSKKPFYKSFIFNPLLSSQKQFSNILEAQKIFLKYKNNIEFIEYKTFDDYYEILKKIFTEREIDIAFLGAAVSDYKTKPVEGKISSKDDFVIKLEKTDKVIKNVKTWSKTPVFQVGFKLLSKAIEEELTETAYKSGLENRSNLTVANDLKTIKLGKREIFIVTPEKGVIKIKENIARELLDFTVRRANVKHFKTDIKINKKLFHKYEKEFKVMQLCCKLLYEKNFMPPFFSGSKSSHGSIALKVGDGFLITARGSNKENLPEEDLVLVKKVDWKNRVIFLESVSGKKASLNAPLMSRIFSAIKNVSAVVHTHSFDPNHASTLFPETPGTIEYANAPIADLKRSPVVNLRNHGLISVGEDIVDAMTQVLKNKKIKGTCYDEFPDLYDLIYQRFTKSVPDFVKIVDDNTVANGHILDMAAGTGEASLPLLRKGFKVSSLDLSRGMLDQFNKKVPKKYKGVSNLIISDVSKIDFRQEFDTVCIRQAINYLSPNNLGNTFKKVYKALNPQGTFVFNAPNFRLENKNYKNILTIYNDKNSETIVSEKNKLFGRLLEHKQKALIMPLSHKGGMVVEDTNSFYMYNKDEFEKLLRSSGFTKVQFLSSGLKKYSNKDKTLYCVARK